MRVAALIVAGALAWSAFGNAAPAWADTAPAADPTAGQVDALQQRLLASQQTIATLERQLADAKNSAVAMDQCRVKNGRLVFIGRELIEGYARRYRETRKDPLQLGRRRFEFELQSLSDAVYDNRADVPVAVPGDKRQPNSSAPISSVPNSSVKFAPPVAAPHAAASRDKGK